jgi:hypothetical protein
VVRGRGEEVGCLGTAEGIAQHGEALAAFKRLALRAGFSPVLFTMGTAMISWCPLCFEVRAGLEVVHEDGIEPPTIPV